MLFLVDEMNIGYNKIKKIGNRKSACEVIVRVHVINNSCFNGKGALGSLDRNNRKARAFLKDEGCLRWLR